MNSALTHRASTVFLQAVIVLIGIGVLAFLLIEPHFEGRNNNATLFAIYFNDPFLAYVYVGSIPFFVGVYKGLTLLTFARGHTIFSQQALNAVRTIRYCAFLTAAAIFAADVFLAVFHHVDDDPAGAIMLGLIATLLSVTAGTAAFVCEGVVRRGMHPSSRGS